MNLSALERRSPMMKLEEKKYVVKEAYSMLKDNVKVYE
jgi:hypothetical protein